MTSHELNKYTVFRSSASITQGNSWKLLTARASLAPEYNVQALHAYPNLSTQGFLQTDVLAYTIRMRSIMRIEGDRTEIDLGSSASNYVAGHLVGLGGNGRGAKIHLQT